MSDPRDVAGEVQRRLEPLRRELDASSRLRAQNTAYLAEKRQRGLGPEVKQLLEQAAKSPEAPESLRRLAAEVRAGRMTWEQVFSDRDNPLAARFREEANTTAQAHFADLSVEPVEVEPTSDNEADPDQTSTEIEEAREAGREEHDRIWREDLMGGRS